MSGSSKYKHLSDDALDQLYQDAHEQEALEPFFSDEYWSEMEVLLPEKKKRRMLPFWYAGIAATIFIGGLLWTISGKENQDATKLTSSVREAESNVVSVPRQETFRPINNTSNSFGFVSSKEKSAKSVELFQDHRIHLNSQSGNNTLKSKTISEENTDLSPGRAMELITSKENEEEALVVAEIIESKDRSFQKLAGRDETLNPVEIPSFQTKKNPLIRGYLEAALTYGQAPYTNAEGKRKPVAGCIVGGGVQLNSGLTFLQGGLQLRMEGFNGLDYMENNFTENVQRYVSVNQLYSLEIPLGFGYSGYHHQAGITFTPGIQFFMFGKERVITNNVETRSGLISGLPGHSSSATLEMGLVYYYHFNARWSLGAKFNVDLLRPLHTNYYLGQQQSYPLNGQLVLRANLFH